MSLKEDAVDAILNAQNREWSTLPRLVQRAALPPIVPKTTPSMLARNESIEISRPATSADSRPSTNAIGFAALPKLGTASITPLDAITENPKTAMYPIPRTNISYMLNLNDIDENEVLRPDSAASTVLDSARDVIKKVLRIPDTFSEFRELSIDLDQVTSEDIMKMLHQTSSHDHQKSGYLLTTTVLSSIRSIHPSDTWQHLLDWLIATSVDEEGSDVSLEKRDSPLNIFYLIDYQLFFEVLLNDKQSREVLVNITEVLDSDDTGSVFSRLPNRPTSRQEQRERWRAKLLIDLEIILSKNPDIDIDRFKHATDKKIITVEELKMFMQFYGLAEHIQGLEQRIIDCFLTHDHYFCFSAFVGCLNQINPAVLHVRTPSPKISKLAPWSKPPLRKLDDSGMISDEYASGSSK